jgi:hypothetical protein
MSSTSPSVVTMVRGFCGAGAARETASMAASDRNKESEIGRASLMNDSGWLSRGIASRVSTFLPYRKWSSPVERIYPPSPKNHPFLDIGGVLAERHAVLRLR